jgi:hypothetical protein
MALYDSTLRRVRAVAVTALLLLVTVLVQPAEEASAQRPARDPLVTMTFEDLQDAADHGAIDHELVVRLEADEPVDAFVILDGSAAAARIRDRSQAGIERSARLLADLREQVTDAVDVQVLETYDLLPMMRVRLTNPGMALDLVNLREVLSITADRLNRLTLASSLPRINQPQVAKMGLTGRGVTVAVLDSGADFTQAAFGSCTQPGVPAATCRVPFAFDAAPDDGMMDADNGGHGTNVAAIVAGVAPGARIIPIDVADGQAIWDHNVLAGINWVLGNYIARNIRAVNLSFGTGEHFTAGCGDTIFWRNPYGLPFALLRDARVLPVVGAGNNATVNGSFRDGIGYPACTGAALVVGATYSTDLLTPTWDAGGTNACTDSPAAADAVTCFSQDAPGLDLLAPGAPITAGGLTFRGTSQAAPHVSGAAAVLAEARPLATTAEVQSFLTTSPTTVADPRSGRSHPRLDLASAVRAAVPVANDDRAGATILSRWGGQLRQTTWAATKEPTEPAHAGNPGGASVWFQWTAPKSDTAVFTTVDSDFNTLLAAYRVDAAGSLLPVAANDDHMGKQTSRIQFPVTAGDHILLAVDGFRASGSFPEGGNLRFTWNLPNDAIADALQANPGTISGSNIGATHELSEPHHCYDTFASASVWYRWSTASVSTRIQASGSAPLCVAVYRMAVGPGALVAWGDDYGPSPIDFTFVTTSGDTYWIAVDGVSIETACSPTTGQCFYTTPTGTFTLTITD